MTTATFPTRSEPMRYAVRFVAVKGQPVDRPMWLTNIRQRHTAGIGMTPSYKVTDEPKQAQTWATRETAEKWAEHFTYEGLYEFKAEPRPDLLP